jgi:methyl-accepting chemotaxis protein
MDGITTAGKQQEQGIRETNKTMMDIAQISQKNSYSAEEMLEQSTALTNLVESISGLVINLRKFI